MLCRDVIVAEELFKDTLRQCNAGNGYFKLEMGARGWVFVIIYHGSYRMIGYKSLI